jgi:phenylpropionate dioxygenase-like ring-hydroxylating dioxygenase large terminal subunit
MFLGLKQDFAVNYATPIAHMGRLWCVANNNSQYYLVSNVCPHQHSKILFAGSTALVCPYHGFEFDLTGQGINNHCKLERKSCYVVGNFIFDRPVHYVFPIDTEPFKLVEYRRDQVNAPVPVIMDVFLDIQHIPVAHAGVYDKVGITDIDAIKYKTFEGGSIQFVPCENTHHMIKADQQWQLGACWMAIYPDTMIEWQPGALFVTVATDAGVDVYKYRDTRYVSDNWTLNNVVWETAWMQDRQLSENIVELSSNNLDTLKSHHRDYHAVHR